MTVSVNPKEFGKALAIQANSLGYDVVPEELRRWVFSRWSPVKNDLKNISETFSVSDELECALRELFQNLLDADSKVARLRLINVDYDLLVKAIGIDELAERAEACGKGLLLRRNEDGTVPCLLIEDEGCGLTGEYRVASLPGEKPSGAQSYLRGHSNSNKSGTASGSKGEGRIAVMVGSTLRVVIVETCRAVEIDPETGEEQGGETLVCGLAHMEPHVYQDGYYMHDGRFMKLTRPVEEELYDPLIPYIDEEGREIVHALGIERPQGRVGTSQFLPSVHERFTFANIITETIKNHYIAILQGLEVVVTDVDGTQVVLTAESISDYSRDERFDLPSDHALQIHAVRQVFEAMRSPSDLGTIESRIDKETFPEGLFDPIADDLLEGKAVAMRGHYHIRKQQRNGQQPSDGHLSYGALIDKRLSAGLNVLIRSNIVVFDKRQAVPGVVTISVSRDDPITEMLRDGEDTSHTRWDARKMERARGWPLSRAREITSDFRNGALTLYKILVDAEDETEDRALAALFGMPDDDARPLNRKFEDQQTAEDSHSGEDIAEDTKRKKRDLGEAHLIAETHSDSETGEITIKLSLSDHGKANASRGHCTHYVGFNYMHAEGARAHLKSHSPADFNAFDFIYDTDGACVVEPVEVNVVKIVFNDLEGEATIRGNFHPDRTVRAAEVIVEQE